MVHVLMQIEHILGGNAADDAKMKIFALRQHSGVCNVETRTVVRHCNVKILRHYTKKDVINMNQFQLKKRIKNKKIRFEIMWHARGGWGGGRVGSRLTFKKLRFFFTPLNAKEIFQEKHV